MKFLKFAMPLALLVASPMVQAASIVPLFLTDGRITVAEDNNADLLINSDGTYGAGASKSIDPGDFLLAGIHIQEIAREGVPGTVDIGVGTAFNELTGIQLVKVDTVTPIGGGLGNFTFVAPTAAEFAALTAPFLGGVGITPSAVGVTAVLWEDPLRDAILTAGVEMAMATLTNGVMFAEIGFTGGVNGSGNVTPGPGEGQAAVAAPLVIGTGFGAGTVFISQNVLAQGPASAGISFVGAKYRVSPSPPGTAFFGAPDADIQGLGGFSPVDNSNAAAGATLFDVGSDTDFAFRVFVPEPSSMTLAGMGLLGLVGYGYRRRRSA